MTYLTCNGWLHSIPYLVFQFVNVTSGALGSVGYPNGFKPVRVANEWNIGWFCSNFKYPDTLPENCVLQIKQRRSVKPEFWVHFDDGCKIAYMLKKKAEVQRTQMVQQTPRSSRAARVFRAYNTVDTRSML